MANILQKKENKSKLIIYFKYFFESLSLFVFIDKILQQFTISIYILWLEGFPKLNFYISPVGDIQT